MREPVEGKNTIVRTAAVLKSPIKRPLPLPFTSALEGVGWSTPRPGLFAPGERPGTHCIGGWLGLRAGPDGCGKSRPYTDSIPGPSGP